MPYGHNHKVSNTTCPVWLCVLPAQHTLHEGPATVHSNAVGCNSIVPASAADVARQHGRNGRRPSKGLGTGTHGSLVSTSSASDVYGLCNVTIYTLIQVYSFTYKGPTASWGTPAGILSPAVRPPAHLACTHNNASCALLPQLAH
eukprot:GHRQ01024149.1.p1 GENE.GHRQ01024149.1~~GHRQ01024149.1.p1  ORF type:complete len:145 (+),score=4.47 GHRQ01024149.1:304-738(+)